MQTYMHKEILTREDANTHLNTHLNTQRHDSNPTGLYVDVEKSEFDLSCLCMDMITHACAAW